jgi:hypothetical protein
VTTRWFGVIITLRLDCNPTQELHKARAHWTWDAWSELTLSGSSSSSLSLVCSFARLEVYALLSCEVSLSSWYHDYTSEEYGIPVFEKGKFETIRYSCFIYALVILKEGCWDFARFLWL